MTTSGVRQISRGSPSEQIRLDSQLCQYHYSAVGAKHRLRSFKPEKWRFQVEISNTKTLLTFVETRLIQTVLLRKGNMRNFELVSPRCRRIPLNIQLR
jgi:hypothetical protein